MSELIRAIKEEIEEGQKVVEPQKVKLSANAKYQSKVQQLAMLLSPVVIGSETRYLIENKSNREQVEDWIMQVTKKHFKL